MHLRKRAQFLYVRHGKKAVRPTVIVEARRRAAPIKKNGGERLGPHAGIGFTATTKIGNSVVRNRARRRLREAARRQLAEHGMAGVDYVFVARAATPDAPWAALLDDVGNALISVRAEITAERP